MGRVGECGGIERGAPRWLRDYEKGWAGWVGLQ